MRSSLGILALVFLCLSGTARAGIGETEEQVETRHGKAITVLPSRPADAGLTKCYSSGNYLIAVTFLEGKSVREMLTKVDNSKISTSEIYKFLDARGRGSSWNIQEVKGPARVTAGVQQWRSNDERSRVAIYDSQTRALFITTQQFINLTNGKKQRNTVRIDPRDLGARGRPMQGMNTLDRGSALNALRRDQPQPAATPAK